MSLLQEFNETILPEVKKLEKLTSYKLPYQEIIDHDTCDELAHEYVDDADDFGKIQGLYCNNYAVWIEGTHLTTEPYDYDR